MKKLAEATPIRRFVRRQNSIGLDVDPDKHVFELSMGERQRVEIIKLLLLDAQILIFDEPTAVLTPPEIDAFFSVVNRLRSENKGVVFITHKLEEVLKTC